MPGTCGRARRRAGGAPRAPGPCALAAQVLSKPDSERFVASAHLLCAPGGVFFGTTGGAETPGAARLSRCATWPRSVLPWLSVRLLRVASYSEQQPRTGDHNSAWQC